MASVEAVTVIKMPVEEVEAFVMEVPAILEKVLVGEVVAKVIVREVVTKVYLWYQVFVKEMAVFVLSVSIGKLNPGLIKYKNVHYTYRVNSTTPPRL